MIQWLRICQSAFRCSGCRFDPWIGVTGDPDGKESACNARDPGLIPGSGRSPEEGNGSPLQYPCLENSMNRRA